MPTICEIIDTKKSLGVNKAIGHKKVPSYFLKAASLVTAPYLIFYLNILIPKHSDLLENFSKISHFTEN